MKPIPIISCPLCDPDFWIIEGNSEGIYICKECEKLTTKILRRKIWKEKEKIISEVSLSEMENQLSSSFM